MRNLAHIRLAVTANLTITHHNPILTPITRVAIPFVKHSADRV